MRIRRTVLSPSMFAGARRMAEDEIALQVVRACPSGCGRGREFAEAGVDAVDGGVLGQDILDDLARGLNAGAAGCFRA